MTKHGTSLVKWTCAQCSRAYAYVPSSCRCGCVLGDAPKVATKPKAKKGPNPTEARYRDTFLRGDHVEYEPRSFALACGHSYTPDWRSNPDPLGDCALWFHEVKGPHIHSRDSRILFDCARTEYQQYGWVWAQWTGKEWRRKVYPPVVTEREV